RRDPRPTGTEHLYSQSTTISLGSIVFGVVGPRFGKLRPASLWLSVLQPLVIAPLLLAPSSIVPVFLAVLAGTFAAPMVTLRSRAAELTTPPGTAGKRSPGCCSR